MANILKIQMPDISATIKTEEHGRPIPGQDISPQPVRKIRVLIVITRLTIGGDTNVVLDIANYLNNHPHFEVSLAVGPVPDYEIDLTHLAYERSIPTTLIPTLVNHINPWLNLSAVLQLRALMIQGKYDIVHTHSSVAGVVGRLAALTARVPVIVHHVHGWGLGEDLSIGTRVLYLSLERLCARFTERMIAVSRPTIQKGLAHRICQKEKFVLIYNGIHLENFRRQIDEQRVRLELGLDPKCKLVGMIGRLDKQKNPLDFIRAAAIVVKDYPQVQFLIAGDGSLRPECESLINELKLQGRFFLLGFRNDIDKILPILTLTVLSSLWEGLPVVFQEAMSAGKPIVANNVDGASDVVVDGETGCLVTPHQPQEMAERILYLLNNDKLCEEMGLTAQRFSERFSSQQMVEKIESLYRELLASYDAKSKLKSLQPHKITQME
jgi:glycosyltransferase involved in cell wall biosynthesis